MLNSQIKFFRIYGSKLHYGNEPYFNPLKKPIELCDFPSHKDICKIFLGEIPNEIFNALSFLKKSTYIFPNQEEYHKYLSAIDEQPPIQIEKWAWFITLCIEHNIELDIKYTNAERTSILHRIAKKIKDEKYEYFNLILNRLTSYILTSIGEDFFSNIIAEDSYFFVNDKVLFEYDSCLAIGTSLIINPAEDSPDIDLIKKSLEKLKKYSENKHKMIDSCRYWYLQSLLEIDKWKKFIWGFLAFEILINKLFKLQYKTFTSIIETKMSENDDNSDHYGIFTEIINDTNRLNLKQKFAIISYTLSPANAKEDISNFKLVKKQRDQIAHGAIKDAKQLNLNLLFTLLAKYFHYALFDLL